MIAVRHIQIKNIKKTKTFRGKYCRSRHIIIVDCNNITSFFLLFSFILFNWVDLGSDFIDCVGLLVGFLQC